MLPAWSLNVVPLVFIILRYGSLMLRCQNPVVWSQGSHMSLRTTSTTLPAASSRSRSLSPSSAPPDLAPASSAPPPSSSRNTPRSKSPPRSSSAETVSSALSVDAAELLPLCSHAPGASGRPCRGSCTYARTSAWIAGERKLPWMVLTPRGGCAGMTSTPTTRPPGTVRSAATWDQEPGA
jgi:hypothetical protein